MKNRHEIILILAIILCMAIISAGCTQQPVGPAGVTPTPTATTPAVTTPAAGIANPAAVYCTSKNYSYEIRKNPDGSEYGICILPDGTECDEWAYFRGTCPAVTTPVTTTGAGLADPSAVLCTSKNYTFEIRKNLDGSEYGVCIFPNGKECDSWAYFRNECNETTAK